MNIEDYAERQRLEASAKAKRIAQKKSDRAQFYSGGGVFSAGESSQPATTGSNGSIRAGQPTPVLRAGGIVQYDTPSRSQPEEPLIPVIQKGEVAVLATVQNDGWQLWLGGIHKPKLIMDGLATEPSATLEMIGKKEWMISIRWVQVPGNFNSTAIAMRYSDSSRDWEITDDPRAGLVNYYGNGFWSCSQPLLYPRFFSNPSDYWEIVEENPYPNLSQLPIGLATVGTNLCHPQIGGQNSTIAVAYCEERVFQNGALSATNTGGSNYTGFKQNPNIPIDWSGINLHKNERDYIGEWEGNAQGPGFLGVGGAGCFPVGSGLVEGTEFIPNLKTFYEDILESQLITQSYTVSAANGVISVSSGTHEISYSYRSRYNFSSGGVSRQINYRGECREYVSPSSFLHSIGFEIITEWPLIPPSTSTSPSTATAELINAFQVAPTITKTFGFTTVPAPSTNSFTQQLQTQAEYYYPLKSFFGGSTYAKYAQTGLANISTAGKLPSFVSGSTNPFSYYLLFNNIEYRLVNTLDDFAQNYNSTWLEEAGVPYPVGYQAKYQELPSNAINNDKNNIFKNDVTFDIYKYNPSFVSGEITYEISEKRIAEKKALNMKSIGVTAKVVAVKWWVG